MIKFQKFGIKLLLAVFIFVTVAGSLLYSQPAKAQLAVGVAADAPRAVDKILDKIQYGLKTAVVNIAVQAFSYFVRRISYDTAVWLASGGKGQTPFAHYKNFGGYLSDVADNTAGVAIDELGKPYGLNLCKIPDPKIDLAMRIGLTYKFMNISQTQSPNPPSCTWSSFQNDVLNADNWQSQFGSSASIARKFNVAFSVEQSDLGILMSATEKIDSLVAKQTAAETLQRQEGDGYKAKTSLISGDIVTPAKNIASEAQSQNPSEQKKSTEAGFLATLGTGLEGSIGGAVSLFLNTLGSQLLRNYQTKGMFPFGVCIGENGGPDCVNKLADTLNRLEGQASRGGQKAAQDLFSDLLTPPKTQIDQYNVLVNFASCPTDSPGPENCVADAGLAQAANETNLGKPVTIGDALTKNWLHGDWKLLAPERSADNVDPSCHQRAYCYANIAKLRKSRILPLGFEIAVLNSNPDKPWTLKQVVDGFNDCNFIKDVNGNVTGVNNDPVNKPFCHLIDPNWVIKAPLSKCNAVAFGASPYIPNAPNRAQECVDLSTCVAYDKDGNCTIQGYCTRERNTWRVDVGKCDSQYRTCQSFQDSTGKPVSYLYRTLDTGYCTPENAGCAEYSLKQDNIGKWAGYSKNDLLNIGENSAIYFNSKISSNCSANSDGCSLFQTASTSEKLYLRQAPYYLQCYDSNPNTLAIDWPKTTSDLNKLSTNPKCGNYSAACIPDEVSCNWYQPVSYAGDSIPGKFTPATIVENQIVWNDQCDKKCVGYSAYREMPSNYSAGQPLAYIIPSSGSTCGAVDEGCTSFTNVGGTESVEHYSYLRPCILPDTAKQKNFYTYEGSVVGGYQLKGFILEKDTDGSPKYFYTTGVADKAAYDAVCSESLYKQGLASPDCRQFNDDAGTVYYKLLAKTIAVSQSCAPYRLNNTELTADGKCFQNGELRDGQCFYFGLPGNVQNTAGSSKSCSAEVSSCRAYKGNAGNNVRNILSDNFEGSATGALQSWGPVANISQSLESTHAGEHSLAYNGSGGAAKDLSLSLGRSYDLTFWAKGSAGGTVTVVLDNGTVSTFGKVSVGDVWQSYHLGPIELAGTVVSTKLKFIINGQLFLDNVSLKEVSDYIYLVKNTLKVDPVCDSNLSDNLPGEALGCSEYKNPDGMPIYLTRFSALCREKAIGCTSVYDTRKTPDEPGPRAYNVWLAGAEGTKITKVIGGQTYTCQVILGQTGCYVNTIGATTSTIITDAGDTAITPSTIYVQPDTPSTAPIYLVASKDFACGVTDLGCVKAGRMAETITGPTYGEVLIKNDPASYNTTLCQKEAVGCNAYASTNGTSYFKDPIVIGQKVCSYKQDVMKNGVKYNGWFWKGIGVCSNNNSQFCSANTDCGVGNTCAGIDAQPCYPNYLQANNIYGLWSYGDTQSYKNFVGECPGNQSGCTEFVDHKENNKPYYLINDDRLKSRQGECNGQISEKFGCILFDKTDSPNKLWSSALSYAASIKVNEDLVVPVADAADPTKNDSNVILKVDRDRECGEWMQCQSSHRVFDPQSGSYKEVCDYLGRCNKASESVSQGDTTNCDPEEGWLITHDLTNQVLTDSFYRNRITGWNGMDFSGYSILNQYPMEELVEVNFGTVSNKQWRLAKKIPCGGGSGVNCVSGSKPEDIGCITPTAPCGRGKSGVCIGPGTSNICVQGTDGTTANINLKSIGQSCRAYPEEASPFPNTGSISQSTKYASVNVCNESPGFTFDKLKSLGCDCDYTKVTYGDAFTKYWNFDKPNSNEGIVNYDSTIAKPTVAKGVVRGICLGGDNAGRACGKEDDCAGTGTCEKLKKQTNLIGWHGYCLEPDISRPLNADPNEFACLTWLPVATINGVADVNSQHVESGFQTSQFGGKFYCLGAKGNQQTAPSVDYNKLMTTVIVAHNQNVCSNSLAKCNNVNSNCSGGGGVCTVGYFRDCGVFSCDPEGREKRMVSGLSGQDVTLDELDYIKISTKGQGGSSDWFGNRTFIIRNGLVTKYSGSQSVVGKEFPKAALMSGESGGIAPGYVYADGSDTSDNAVWILRFDDGGGDGDDNAQYADRTNEEQSAKRGWKDLLIDGATDGSSNTSTGEGAPGGNCANVGLLDVNGTDNLQDCFGDGDNTDDGCAVKITFANKKVNKVNVVCFTDDSGDAEAAKVEVYAGLREPCTQIAQTEDVPYSSVGLTDRLWLNTKYSVTGLNYPGALQSQPFGSLGLDVLAPDKLINVFSHYDKTTFDPPPAIVGSPYSCTGRNCLETNVAILDETKRGRASGKSLQSGATSLSEIYAKISSVWVWGTGPYTQTGAPYNVTETQGTAASAPKIRPLGACKSGSHCLEGASNGFVLNDLSAGNVVFSSGGVAPVNIKFFAFADKNQMPIRQMKVDWGDGTGIVDLNGYFRNQRGAVAGNCDSKTNTCFIPSVISTAGNPPGSAPVTINTGLSCAGNADCSNSDSCLPENLARNFGQIVDKTCDNAYQRFDHVYKCTRDALNGWNAACPDASISGGCCVFRPKVQIKDNFGWCNGSCRGAGNASGCYDATWGGTRGSGVDECVSAAAWTTSAVQVIVAPQ